MGECLYISSPQGKNSGGVVLLSHYNIFSVFMLLRDPSTAMKTFFFNFVLIFAEHFVLPVLQVLVFGSVVLSILQPHVEYKNKIYTKTWKSLVKFVLNDAYLGT